MMDYSMFQQLYFEYGGVMPEDMFSLQVLEITQKELNRIKQNSKFQTHFLMKGKQDWNDRKMKTTIKENVDFDKGELRPNQLRIFADAIIFIEAERKYIESFDVNRIMYATGALEVDILDIMNRMKSETLKKESAFPEDNGGR